MTHTSLNNNLLSNDFKVFGKSGPDNLAFDASKYGSSQIGGKRILPASLRVGSNSRKQKKNAKRTTRGKACLRRKLSRAKCAIGGGKDKLYGLDEPVNSPPKIKPDDAKSIHHSYAELANKVYSPPKIKPTSSAPSLTSSIVKLISQTPPPNSPRGGKRTRRIRAK